MGSSEVILEQQTLSKEQVESVEAELAKSGGSERLRKICLHLNVHEKMLALRFIRCFAVVAFYCTFVRTLSGGLFGATWDCTWCRTIHCGILQVSSVAPAIRYKMLSASGPLVRKSYSGSWRCPSGYLCLVSSFLGAPLGSKQGVLLASLGYLSQTSLLSELGGAHTSITYSRGCATL